MNTEDIHRLWPELTRENCEEIKRLIESLRTAAARPQEYNVDAYLRPLASGAHTMLAWAVLERERLTRKPSVECVKRAIAVAAMVESLLLDRDNPTGELPQYWDRPL